MNDFKENKIKVVVRSSKCCHYQPGDTIYIDYSMVDKEKSANICLTALTAIYHFIYAARKHVSLEQMGFSEMCFQCPDIEEKVEFFIIQYDEPEPV